MQGPSTTTRDVVDAIAALFGVEPGRKTLLVSVLDAPTTADGAAALDYDDIPTFDADVDEWIPAEVVDLDDLLTPGSPEETDTFDDSAVHPLPDDPVILDSIASPDVSASPHTGDDKRIHQANGKSDTPTLLSPSPTTGDNPNPTTDPASTETDTPEESNLPALEVPPSRPVAPRVQTEWQELEKGYLIEERWEPDVEPRDHGADLDNGESDHGLRSKVVLSFYDVANGFLPLRARDAKRLAGGPVKAVHILGEQRDASLVGDNHLRISDGAALFQTYEVVPGTVIHLAPGALGVIELELHPDPHPVTDIWLLELDEEGRLSRERRDSVEVRWETDGPVYRCERRWEDLKALHAEANASSLDLVIRVFDQFGQNGLTVDEVWQLVALYRLFAITTIRQILSRQSGLFELRDGKWFKSGDTVIKFKGNSGAYKPAAPTSGARPQEDPAASAIAKIRRAARALASMLTELDDPTVLNDVAATLGLQVVAGRASRDCLEAARTYMRSPDEKLLAALRREIVRYPELSNVVVTAVAQSEGDALTRSVPLLEVVQELGVPGAVSRAADLLDHVSRPSKLADESLRPAERVEEALFQLAHSGLREDGAIAEIVRALTELRNRSAYDEPSHVREELVQIERLLRRGRRDFADDAAIDAGRAQLLAAIDAEIGRVDFHHDIARQELLLTLRLLQGDLAGLFDAIKEFGNYLSATETTAADAHAVFRAGVALAEARNHRSKTTRFIADHAKSLDGAAAGLEMQRFLEEWGALAGIKSGSPLHH